MSELGNFLQVIGNLKYKYCTYIIELPLIIFDTKIFAKVAIFKFYFLLYDALFFKPFQKRKYNTLKHLVHGNTTH